MRGRAVRLIINSTLLDTIGSQPTGYSAANDNAPAYISPSGVRLIWLGENTFGPSRSRQCFCAYRAIEARSSDPIRAFLEKRSPCALGMRHVVETLRRLGLVHAIPPCQ